jgi:hypothetical protein
MVGDHMGILGVDILAKFWSEVPFVEGGGDGREDFFLSGDDGEVEEGFVPRGLLFLQDHVYCMLRK